MRGSLGLSSFAVLFIHHLVSYSSRVYAAEPSSARMTAASDGPPFPDRSLYTTKSVESILEEANSITYPPENGVSPEQERIPLSQPFPCEVTDGMTPGGAKSVHRLRPGDINVIAAMGDSLTCGTAARETSFIGVPIQERGLSFTGGGMATWREFTTLPNIIKIYNSNLTGYATGRGDFLSSNARLNMAVPAAIDDDLFNQVQMFMKKIKKDPKIDFKNDWKMLSIMIGGNDICSMECFDKKMHSSKAHKHHLQKSLDYLYKNVPRLFVNLISILDPSVIERFPNGGVACTVIKRILCRCLYQSSNMKENIVQMGAQVRKYQEAERELVFSGRYDGREDFTVELQPCFLSTNAPKSVDEPESEKLMDFVSRSMTLFTPDCFHFNQRGIATVAIQMWNNMLEPVGNKSQRIDDMVENRFKCPTKENPYFFTRKNSENFYKFGRQ